MTAYTASPATIAGIAKRFVENVRVNRWAKKGVLQAVFLRLQQMGIIKIKVNVVSLDFICIKVHPDGMGALKKERPSLSADPGVDGLPYLPILPNFNMVAASGPAENFV